MYNKKKLFIVLVLIAILFLSSCTSNNFNNIGVDNKNVLNENSQNQELPSLSKKEKEIKKENINKQVSYFKVKDEAGEIIEPLSIKDKRLKQLLDISEEYLIKTRNIKSTKLNERPDINHLLVEELKNKEFQDEIKMYADEMKVDINELTDEDIEEIKDIIQDDLDKANFLTSLYGDIVYHQIILSPTEKNATIGLEYAYKVDSILDDSFKLQTGDIVNNFLLFNFVKKDDSWLIRDAREIKDNVYSEDSFKEYIEERTLNMNKEGENND